METNDDRRMEGLNDGRTNRVILNAPVILWRGHKKGQNSTKIHVRDMGLG
jgi:hypothetical protein